jgi:hypothetical protein
MCHPLVFGVGRGFFDLDEAGHFIVRQNQGLIGKFKTI